MNARQVVRETRGTRLDVAPLPAGATADPQVTDSQQETATAYRAVSSSNAMLAASSKTVTSISRASSPASVWRDVTTTVCGPAPAGSGAAASTSGEPGGRLPQRGQYRQPEPLRIPLIASGRHPRDALRQPRRARLADPGSQQHRLPAARAGTRDHRHG
jgi:hypothetical protein